MKTKLTLSMDPELIKYARTQAHKKGTSVSGMFADYLNHQKAQTKTVPTVAEMVGSLKGYNIDDSKAGIRDAYAKKYLR